MNDDPNAFTDEELEEIMEEIERDYMDNVLGIASYDEMDSWVELDGIIFDNASELYEHIAEHYDIKTGCCILYNECAIRDEKRELEILAPYYERAGKRIEK